MLHQLDCVDFSAQYASLVEPFYDLQQVNSLMVDDAAAPALRRPDEAIGGQL